MSISVCNAAGCPELSEGRTCAQHVKSTYAPRPPGSTTERGYGSAWQKTRKQFFDEGGQCVKCSIRPAEDLDHIVALEDGGTHDPLNLQPLCRKCHRKKTAVDTAKRKRS